MQEVDYDKSRAAPKKRRRAKRKPSKIAYFLMLVLALFCLATVLSVTLFKINSVTVSGGTRYSNTQVIGASGIKSGTSLLRINKSAVSKSICSALPFVADVKVSFMLPSAVKLVVTEDSPCYALLYHKKYFFTDKNFKALEKGTDLSKHKGVVVIEGVNILKFDVGKETVFSDNTQKGIIGNLQNAIKEAGIAKISRMNVGDSYELSVIYDNRITIIVGTQTEADQKLEDAAAIIKAKIQSSDRGSLDVSAQNKRYSFCPA